MPTPHSAVYGDENLMMSEEHVNVQLRRDFPVELIGHDGDDERVVRAARVSTMREENKGGERRLIRYLAKNGHWSPFEHVTFTFRSELPIFIARQVMRHQSQSFNEMSMRYSEALPHFHMPATFHYQSNTMKQGRKEEVLPPRTTSHIKAEMLDVYRRGWDLYQLMIDLGVSREQARGHLPVSTYTVLYTTANLRSLIHFLGDREEQGAQLEVQEYAANVREAIKDIVPITLEVLSEL